MKTERKNFMLLLSNDNNDTLDTGAGSEELGETVSVGGRWEISRAS